MLYVLGRKRGNPAGEHAPGETAQKKAQVGRGRRESLGGHAQQEIFKPENDSDLLLEMRQQENRIRQHLIAKLDNGMKWYIVVVAHFKKMITTDQRTLEERMQSSHLSSQTFKAFNQLDIDTDLSTAYKNLFTKFDEQERQGSGWYLSKIIQIEVHTANLSPLAASSVTSSRQWFWCMDLGVWTFGTSKASDVTLL